MPPIAQPIQPPHTTHSPVTRNLWIFAIVLAACIFSSVAILQIADANTDYICTKVIQSDAACANGSWSNWQTVSQTTDSNTSVVTTIKQRTYTGTREVSRTLQYLNLRTQCDAGYQQAVNGSGGGASGFHGGTVSTENSACQLSQTESMTSGTGGSDKFTTTPTDLGRTTSPTTQAVSSLGELNASQYTGGSSVWAGNASANIATKPSLIRKGGTTLVVWRAEGVKSCSVTSANGDAWEGIMGTSTTRAIMGQTIYTLHCAVDEVTTLTAQTKVDLIPVFQEQ